MGEWERWSVPTDPRALPKDFISVADWPREALESILSRAGELKALRAKGAPVRTLEGRSIALYFEKPSLRTHTTFEVGIYELGAHPIFLPPGQVRIGGRESVEDAARNLSLWCHALVARTFEHRLVVTLGEHASMPIVNALTDELHPCQVMADALTITEHADLRTARLVWVGDGNNVTRSLIHLAARLGMHLTVCSPESRLPDGGFLRPASEEARSEGGEIRLETDPRVAVRDADFVYTDSWYSMGEEEEAEERRRLLGPYQINADLLSGAPGRVRVLHCLPAHRGEEITDEVMDSNRSLIFPQAENRLHAQKAILEAVLPAP